MKLRVFCLSVLSVLILPFLASDTFGDTLGSASSFAVLGEAGVTNAGVGTLGATVITGDLGGSQGTPAVTGFPPGIVNGTIFTTGAPNQAFSDLTTAYNTLAGLTPNATLLPDLGGLTLSPGVYSVPAGTTNLSGVLTLDDKGVGGSRFVFQLSSTLITSPNSSIDVSKLHLNDQVFFVVGSGATLGDNSDFIGNILALDQIAFDPGATDLCGRALSKTASVTFAGQNPTTGEQNEVSIGCSAVAIGGGGSGGGSGGGLGGGTTGVAEPSTLSLLLGGLISFGFLSKRLLLS